jgi:3-methylcrotonyl-CoA carboxylase alpha subunit
MFDRLLIANRGEIACRIIRTARRLGLGTVAVYSDADRSAWHVAQADQAVRLGPAPARESYLNIEAILEAARAGGAQAVHPGYGFLAENADFAEACQAAGLTFVGPPAAAIRAMGDKSRAKAIMAAAGVPVVPGYHETDQVPARLQEAAAAIGYPVMIKASAGGGGKGMRVVERAADFPEALAGARREAAGAFGDDRVLLEKHLIRPRHIELQVFADGHGRAVHLFERDCSIQRRHQKVLEEAPAPGLSAERRGEMAVAALAAARAVGYVGAGTVEFLAQADAFYFLEMNTRLQVEHPVTEMITGQDLVEWQLRVAAGEPLPRDQDDLEIRGHAIEARLYAEDPARGFLPAAGRIGHLSWPAEDDHLRIDGGVRQGDRVTSDYDPLLAKVIVWDRDRPAALGRLVRALGATQVGGLATNLGFLAALAGHPALAAGQVDTGFIGRHQDTLVPAPGPASDSVLALASLAELLHRRNLSAARARDSSDPHSPWHLTTGWRLNMAAQARLVFLDGERRVAVAVHYLEDGYRLSLPGGELRVRGALAADGTLSAEIEGRICTATVLREGPRLTILRGPRSHVLALDDPLSQPSRAEVPDGRLVAPMPGKVIRVQVAAGQTVARGAPLLVLEAMKMEHTIRAPSEGRISAVHFGEGDLVDEGAELVDFERPGELAGGRP